MGDDLLAFAGIPPAQALAIPKANQFAEKIHAYTRPWADRINTRTKDLADLVLLIETTGVEPAGVNVAVQSTFGRRNTHPVPVELPDPPATWAREFTTLATEAQLRATTLASALEVVRNFWRQAMA